MYRETLTATTDQRRKTCPGCTRSLLLKFFDPNRARRDGLQSHCRKCRKEQREALRNGKHRNGNGRSSGNGHRQSEEEEGNGSGYTPIWKQPKASRKELLLQRDRYLSIINAASLALESIEARLGIAVSAVAPEEEAATQPEPDFSDEDIEDDLE